MNQTEEQALNEKFARRAGFEPLTGVIRVKDWYDEGEKCWLLKLDANGYEYDLFGWTFWNCPDGGIRGKHPDFLDRNWGIAHFFRWIWPLIVRNQDIEINFTHSTAEEEGFVVCRIRRYFLTNKPMEEFSGFGRDNQIAVAAAKAVVQLIDSQEGKDE